MRIPSRMRGASRRWWSAALAAVTLAPALAVLAAPSTPATAAAGDDDHYPAVVIRRWEIVPPQANNCIYNGTPFGGPGAYYNDKLGATCGSYQYTDFINPSGQYYRMLYQHVTGWSYTWYGDEEPPPPNDVPKEYVHHQDPPIPYGAVPSKPEEFGGPILGKWRMKPTKVGGVWYAKNSMTVAKDGYGILLELDKDSCGWRSGSPIYKNLKGKGPTYTGMRWRGPCVKPEDAWTPVTITISPDGNTLTEQVTGYPDPFTWLREPRTIDCGGQRILTGGQVARVISAAGNTGELTPEQMQDVVDNPCTLRDHLWLDKLLLEGVPFAGNPAPANQFTISNYTLNKDDKTYSGRQVCGPISYVGNPRLWNLPLGVTRITQSKICKTVDPATGQVYLTNGNSPFDGSPASTWQPDTATGYYTQGDGIIARYTNVQNNGLAGAHFAAGSGANSGWRITGTAKLSMFSTPEVLSRDFGFVINVLPAYIPNCAPKYGTTTQECLPGTT